MKDTKMKSLVESIFNIVVGYSVAFTTNIIILPLFGFNTSISTFTWIGVIYTAVSLIRSYLIRRMFVNGFYEFIKKK